MVSRPRTKRACGIRNTESFSGSVSQEGITVVWSMSKSGIPEWASELTALVTWVRISFQADGESYVLYHKITKISICDDVRSTRNRDLPGLLVWCSRWNGSNSTSTTHFSHLQHPRPLEGAAGVVKPLHAMGFERPKTTGTDQLRGFVEFKGRVILGSRWKEPHVKDR